MSKKNGEIVVKVFRTGSQGKEVALDEGDRSLRTALKAAGLSKKESEIIKVNGTEIEDLDHELEDKDRILLVKNIEGGR